MSPAGRAEAIRMLNATPALPRGVRASIDKLLACPPKVPRCPACGGDLGERPATVDGCDGDVLVCHGCAHDLAAPASC